MKEEKEGEIGAAEADQMIEKKEWVYEGENLDAWIVREDSGYQEIEDRTFQYSLRILRLCRYLFGKNDPIASPVSKQLLRSGSSIGANVAEAKSAESRADFVHKFGIALKEARETEYWIRLLIEGELISRDKGEPILNETDQIIAVLTSIIVKSKRSG